MWRRPRLVNRGHETPGPRPGRCARLRGAFAPEPAGSAGDGSGPWPTAPRWSAERRPPGCAGGPTPRKRGVAPYQRDMFKAGACRRSAIPSRGWQQDEGYPGRRKRRGSGESCGSRRIAVRRNERVVAGTSGTGLFDIVNRGSAHRAGCVLSAGATHRHALSPPLEQHTRLSSPRRRGPSIPAVRVYGTMGPRFRGDDSS